MPRERWSMLTAATIGMAGYGVYEVMAGLLDLVTGHRLEIVADLASVVFGVLLVLAAAFVRVRIPGGLLFAVGALLGLQALAIHRAAHLTGVVTPAPQLARGAFAALLVALALAGPPDRAPGQ
jgi:hypothetical protein